MRSEVRAPQLKVTLNGSVLPGAISADIESNNHFAADRFRLRFAAKVIPQNLLHIPGGRLEVTIGLDSEWLTCVIGHADSVSFDVVQGTIDIEGRDLSSLLIETQMDDAFANHSASEIAVLIGARHGIPVLADQTTTPIGRYYQSEHDRVNLSQFGKTMTEWDLLASLANREGFDLFMEGAVLRFGLPVPLGSKALYPEDCTSLHLEHCVGLARPINVVVRSWSSRTGEAVVAEQSSIGLGLVWPRKITKPNLTHDDAQQQAAQIVADLKRHEWAATLTMPGELALTSRSLVAIRGTRSAWDRLYRVTQLRRRVDVRRGFTQSLTLQGVY